MDNHDNTPTNIVFLSTNHNHKVVCFAHVTTITISIITSTTVIIFFYFQNNISSNKGSPPWQGEK